MITAEATHHRQIACSTNSSMPVRYNVKANPTVASAAKRRATRRSAANLGCRPTRPTANSAAYPPTPYNATRSEEHTSELQSHSDLVCRLLLEKKKKKKSTKIQAPPHQATQT